jgi:hypothetical protein
VRDNNCAWTKLEKMKQRSDAVPVKDELATGEELIKLNLRIEAQKSREITSTIAIDRWLERAMQNIASAHYSASCSNEFYIDKKDNITLAMRSILETIHDLRTEIETSKIEK